MHNWFAMETEADFRRQEWQRAAAADARADALRAAAGRPRFEFPRLSLAGLRRLSVPSLGFVAPFALRRRGTTCEAHPSI